MKNERFININEAIDFVTNRKNHGKGLEDFKRCLAESQLDLSKLKVIHVAGTNGKGSVTHFLMDVYKHNGYKVGAYTSPHLISHLDRIRINDEWISETKFLLYLNKYMPLIDKYDLSMFEIDTLIMVDSFIEEKVDLAIVEVGLGGRLDSTNIFDDPLCSVITNIGMDHMERLGNTIEAIAKEKAGIIRKNHKVFTGKMDEKALKIIESFTSEGYLIKCNEALWNDQISLANKALYQKENITLVLTILNDLKKDYPYDNESSILSESIWRGRFECINKDPKIIVDGAHNMDGVKALCDTLEREKDKYVIVFCSMKDKPGKEMISMLKPYAKKFIVTEIDMPRCEKAINLKTDEDIMVIENASLALKEAIKSAYGSPVLMCGSLYFVSWAINNAGI